MKKLKAFVFLGVLLLLTQLYAVTPVWITGFEYGLATPVTSGSGLFTTVNGTPAINTTAKRSGTYGLEIASSAAIENLYKNNIFGGASYYVVASVYICFHTKPDATTRIFSIIHQTSGIVFGLSYYQSTDKFYIQIGSGTTQPSASTVTVDTWYRIDIKYDASGTTWTMDWKIDGVDQTQATEGSHTAGYFATNSALQIGLSAAVTCSIYYDDIAVSATSGDYPIGAHAVVGLRPNADGTHNNAANIMEDSAGTDIDGTVAWSLLEEDPWVTTADADYVRQTDIGAGNYCEIAFADTTGATIHGVMAVMQYASAGTAANDGEFRIRDAATQETVIYNGDMSETSAYYKSAIVTPPVAGWSNSNVNSLVARFGYSGDAADDPYWLAIMLEVAYVGEVSGETYIPKVIIIQ